MNRRRRSSALLLLSLSPLSLWAQSRVAGRVVRVAGPDTLPVAGISVILHHVGTRNQGPVDTTRTGAGGRFGFRFAADTTASYLLSARHGGIEYFSPPIATNPARPDTAVVLIVADTSSTTPVLVKQRTVLVSAPDESGTRAVLDWFVLSNPGQLTRVAGDSTRPSWAVALPAEVQNVELADNRMSQFSPDALVFRKDSALVFAPISPGDKELMLQYHIPATLKRFVLPSSAVRDSVYVLLEERGGAIGTPRFARADSQMLDGRRFDRWLGTLQQAGELTIVLPSRLLSSGQLLALMVGAAGLVFAGFAGLLLRRGRTPARAAVLADPAYLADAIARMDARYLDREAFTPPAEWAQYRARREQLKGQLAAALAPDRPGS